MQSIDSYCINEECPNFKVHVKENNKTQFFLKNFRSDIHRIVANNHLAVCERRNIFPVDIQNCSTFQHFTQSFGNNTIGLFVNADGVSPFKSSKHTVWPVTYSIINLPTSVRYFPHNMGIIAIYSGNKNPSDIIIKKIKTHIENELNSDMTIGGTYYKIKVFCCSFDLPAMAKFMGTPHHNSISACHLCLSTADNRQWKTHNQNMELRSFEFPDGMSDRYQDVEECNDAKKNGITINSVTKENRFSLQPNSEYVATGIEDTRRALNMFFNNNFSEAENLLLVSKDVKLYQSLGYSTLSYIKAILTFESISIQRAITACKGTIRIAHQILSKKTKRVNEAEIQAHAKLTLAEASLLMTILSLLNDDNFVTFLRGAIQVRNCYKSYHQMEKNFDSQIFGNEQSKIDYHTGVLMGIGIFNLLFSLLPPKIMRILEFLNFRGNQKEGRIQLEKAASMEPLGLRSPLATLTVILLNSYNYLQFDLNKSSRSTLFEVDKQNLQFSTELIDKYLNIYPKSAIFRIIKSRLLFVGGQIVAANEQYLGSIINHENWTEINHFSYWELFWCSVIQCNWKAALNFMNFLYDRSRWSKAIYLYLKATTMMMVEKTENQNLSHQIIELMSSVSHYKTKIGGRSIPLEKFGMKRAQLYEKNANYLFLPLIEMMYFNYSFHAMTQLKTNSKQFQTLIENEIVLTQKSEDKLLGKLD
ncbi:hypothetical protein SNEBB_004678 [Seison nebaliae]|nr:hypothetical protein SNEBB_004678 [Seison nebaliae]